MNVCVVVIVGGGAVIVARTHMLKYVAVECIHNFKLVNNLCNLIKIVPRDKWIRKHNYWYIHKHEAWNIELYACSGYGLFRLTVYHWIRTHGQIEVWRRRGHTHMGYNNMDYYNYWTALSDTETMIIVQMWYALGWITDQRLTHLLWHPLLRVKEQPICLYFIFDKLKREKKAKKSVSSTNTRHTYPYFSSIKTIISLFISPWFRYLSGRYIVHIRMYTIVARVCYAVCGTTWSYHEMSKK